MQICLYFNFYASFPLCGRELSRLLCIAYRAVVSAVVTVLHRSLRESALVAIRSALRNAGTRANPQKDCPEASRADDVAGTSEQTHKHRHDRQAGSMQGRETVGNTVAVIDEQGRTRYVGIFPVRSPPSNLGQFRARSFSRGRARFVRSIVTAMRSMHPRPCVTAMDVRYGHFAHAKSKRQKALRDFSP